MRSISRAQSSSPWRPSSGGVNGPQSVPLLSEFPTSEGFLNGANEQDVSMRLHERGSVPAIFEPAASSGGDGPQRKRTISGRDGKGLADIQFNLPGLQGPRHSVPVEEDGPRSYFLLYRELKQNGGDKPQHSKPSLPSLPEWKLTERLRRVMEAGPRRSFTKPYAAKTVFFYRDNDQYFTVSLPPHNSRTSPGQVLCPLGVWHCEQITFVVVGLINKPSGNNKMPRNRRSMVWAAA